MRSFQLFLRPMRRRRMLAAKAPRREGTPPGKAQEAGPARPPRTATREPPPTIPKRPPATTERPPRTQERPPTTQKRSTTPGQTPGHPQTIPGADSMPLARAFVVPSLALTFFIGSCLQSSAQTPVRVGPAQPVTTKSTQTAKQTAAPTAKQTAKQTAKPRADRSADLHFKDLWLKARQGKDWSRQ